MAGKFICFGEKELGGGEYFELDRREMWETFVRQGAVASENHAVRSLSLWVAIAPSGLGFTSRAFTQGSRPFDKLRAGSG